MLNRGLKKDAFEKYNNVAQEYQAIAERVQNNAIKLFEFRKKTTPVIIAHIEDFLKTASAPLLETKDALEKLKNGHPSNLLYTFWGGIPVYWNFPKKVSTTFGGI